MFVDVHAHLNDEKFEDIEKVVERAKNANVEKIITAGFDIESSLKNIEIAKKYEDVFVTVGVHPEMVDEVEENYLEKLKEMCKFEKVVAIGEIGLDYHFKDDNKELQKKVFIEQIELANLLNLPIVVHSRDAMGDTLEILKEHTPVCPSLLHCYSGSIESANEFIKLGFSFSFGGVVTFNNAKNVVKVVENLPIEKIMLETDCPYMAPVPYRGKINEPCFVPLVAKKIAEIKNIEIEKIEEKTTKNAKKMFKI